MNYWLMVSELQHCGENKNGPKLRHVLPPLSGWSDTNKRFLQPARNMKFGVLWPQGGRTLKDKPHDYLKHHIANRAVQGLCLLLFLLVHHC